MHINYSYSISTILIVGVLIWIVGNYYGIGITYDSNYYMELADGNSLFEPQQFYSYLMSLFPFHYTETARVLNLLCYVTTLAIWYCLFKPLRLRLLLSLFLTCSLPLILVSSFLWTESLFILIVSLTFYVYRQWTRSRRIHFIILLFVLLMLSVWSRKVGLVLSAALVISVVLELIRDKSRWTKLLLVICFVLLLSVYWIFFFVGESPGLQFFQQNWSNNWSAVTNWLLPVSFPGIVRSVVLVALLFMAYFALSNRDPIIQLFSVFFAIYFIIRLFVDRPYAAEADRYFSILFPPFVYYFGYCLEQMIYRIPKSKQIIIAFLLTFSAVAFVRSVNQVLGWNHSRSIKSQVYLKVESQSQNLGNFELN